MKTDVEYAKSFISLFESSKSRNIEFNMSFKHYIKLCKTKTCFFTKVTFVNVQNHNLSRSIDRLDASLGYTDSNTVVCTKEFNHRKNSLTFEDIKLIYDALKEKLKL